MTTPLGPTTGTTSGIAPKSIAMGKEDFLKLLVTQLQNQDPMSPMDGSEFAAQLAQFATVEQLIEIGSGIESQAASTAQAMLTSQTMLGRSLIGHEVTLRGSTVTADGEAAPRVAIELEGGAERVMIEVLGPDDKVIATQEFEDLGEGRHVLTLDETELDPGHYNYRVTALDADDHAVTAQGYTVGMVDGVSFHGGAVALRIHGSLVPMLDILEVLAATNAAGSVTTNTESSPT